MNSVQDTLRQRQAYLLAAVVTLALTALWVIFVYQKRLADVSEGIGRLQSEMATIFNDNELIADATGTRFQQLRENQRCGSLTLFQPRDGSSWGINADRQAIDPALGALVSRTRDPQARCMYAAAEFIRHKINTLNPGTFDAHRYIVARDVDWFYWFSPADSILFHFSSSQMANRPGEFFRAPESFYDRLLQKDIRIKALSSTHLYGDKITGEMAYSLVSYIYDMSGDHMSDRIIGYLVYDHSQSELRHLLSRAFASQIPAVLQVAMYNNQKHESLCVTDNCALPGPWIKRPLSEMYAIHYALPVYLFAIHDPLAWVAILLAPLLFGLLAWTLRRHLNRGDLRLYGDPLTGTFTRKIFDVVRAQSSRGGAVVLMDCNKFKMINDTWGHEAGDLALQIIARQMTIGVRAKKDMVVRIGGDEFVLLLQHSSRMAARDIAARIAQSIAEQTFNVDGRWVPLSVSWGVAIWGEDLDRAIREADADMYRMKHGGKASPPA